MTPVSFLQITLGSQAVSITPALDLFPLLTGTLAAVSCGLLGNFLVLRRLSLMGDAISHSVLPGLVVAVLLAGSLSVPAMFAGAAVAGVLTVVLVELVKRLGRVEPGAAMGVVFSILFAGGVLLLERHLGDGVHLDADCVLEGQLETLWWPGGPQTWSGVLSFETLRATPRQVWVLAGALLVSGVVIAALFKELRLAAFDAGLATSLGFNAGVLHVLLMTLVAVATVASFEAVGSILVVAMLICPAATARLLTDRVPSQIWVSIAVSLFCGVVGYLSATIVPAAFGKESVSAAGSIACTAGVVLGGTIVLSPRHGVAARSIRRRRFAARAAVEDLLAALYRFAETGVTSVPTDRIRALLAGRPADAAIAAAVRSGAVRRDRGLLSLTPTGVAQGAGRVRKHRLWEHYLVERAGVAPDHVHSSAEHLEHTAVRPPAGPVQDPHGREIPTESQAHGP
ncbi:MAG: iron chelate uptake ABC transporter family permease subunit [Planctomycetota bacterium]